MAQHHVKFQWLFGKYIFKILKYLSAIFSSLTLKFELFFSTKKISQIWRNLYIPGIFPKGYVGISLNVAAIFKIKFQKSAMSKWLSICVYDSFPS